MNDPFAVRLLRRAGNERCFTMVGILVVVLIIAVLAAMAVPSFTSQRGKASDASAKSGARTAEQAEEPSTAITTTTRRPEVGRVDAQRRQRTDRLKRRQLLHRVGEVARRIQRGLHDRAPLLRRHDAYLRARGQGLVPGLGHLVERSSARGSVPGGQ